MSTDIPTLQAAYRRYSPHYDRLFGWPLQAGRRLAVQALQLQPGERVLEAGAGTGLSLPLYPPDVEVLGLDLSEAMLSVARERARAMPWVRLQVGDAQASGLPEGAFDAVCAAYAVTTAPDPAAMLKELLRVCRPGGRVVVLNHFASPGGWRRRAEEALRPWAGALGFEPALDLDALLDAVGARPELRASAPPFGAWTLLRLRKP